MFYIGSENRDKNLSSIIPLRIDFIEKALTLLENAKECIKPRIKSNFVGILVFEHDELKGVAPFLNSDFLQYFLPAIYVMVGLSILKESLKLVVGRWTGKLAVSILVINTAILLLGLFLLRDGAIWNPSFVEELLSLREWGSLDSHAGEIHRMWETAKEWVRIGFVLTILIETVSVMYKGFKK